MAENIELTLHSCFDDSGRWSSGGLFRSLDKTSPSIKQTYLAAKKHRDLHVGDVHIVSVRDNLYVALMVAQKYSAGQTNAPLSLSALTTCLAKLSQFCITTQATVHMPRIGATTPGFNWYGTEKLLRKALCGKGIHVLIYYFTRNTSSNPPKSVNPTSSKITLTSQPSQEKPAKSSAVACFPEIGRASCRERVWHSV